MGNNNVNNSETDENDYVELVSGDGDDEKRHNIRERIIPDVEAGFAVINRDDGESDTKTTASKRSESVLYEPSSERQSKNTTLDRDSVIDRDTRTIALRPSTRTTTPKPRTRSLRRIQSGGLNEEGLQNSRGWD